MGSIKNRLSQWLDIDEQNLNEISIEDVAFTAPAASDINSSIAPLFAAAGSGPSPEWAIGETETIPCKSFWLEATRDLVLYVSNGCQSKAVLVPRNGWTLRDDITFH